LTIKYFKITKIQYFATLHGKRGFIIKRNIGSILYVASCSNNINPI
jgi:hypothetical protein